MLRTTAECLAIVALQSSRLVYACQYLFLATLTWIRANLGHALLRLGRVDEAKREFERALLELNSVEKVDKYVVADVNEALGQQPALAGASDVLEMAERRKKELC